eukprot:TRINITY_DN8306_c0_g1_i1.p1 TRINITY_DN8306_c0_g1~~TRINITY_DN8306_c0_g1_i1.p1  ORF type:complete len:122 (+),score=32.43 TRINITY_DN8306_c0_g1_i1:217-582(+)
MGRLRAAKAAMTLTETAAKRVGELLSTAKPPAEGIKVGVRRRGCNGLAYTMDYVRAGERKKFDEMVESHGVKVFVDSKALMHVIGTEMDFVTDRIRSEFVFTNPNSKGECGCGESFTTATH